MHVDVDKQKVEAFVKRHGITSHRDFARRAGVADSTWWRIWNDERNVGSGVITKILSAYPGTTFEDFFFVASELPSGIAAGNNE